ncbi:hypothetical protein Tco_0116698 [Tanacetum coccineum]
MKRVAIPLSNMDAVARINDPQCEWLLLHACTGISKLYFAMRTCLPRVFESAQRSFDMALLSALERIVTASIYSVMGLACKTKLLRILVLKASGPTLMIFLCRLGRATIDAAHRKLVKYEAKYATIGYGFLPFSFSSLGEFEKDAVTLLKRIQKFSMTQDIGTRAAVHIFNRIGSAVAKGVRAQIVSRLPTNVFKSLEFLIK